MEFTVNADLERHINTPLTTPISTSTVHVDDENEMVDEEPDTGANPISPSTKEQIYTHLAASNQGDEHIDPRKILLVKAMTEGEGQSYLEVLKSRRIVNFSKSVSRKIVASIADSACHPLDQYTPTIIAHDDNLIDEIGMSIGYAMSYLGMFKGYVMLGVYITSSWLKDWGNPMVNFNEEQQVKKLKIDIPDGPPLERRNTTKAYALGNNAGSSVQGNGRQPQPNGENHPNGQNV